MVHSPLSISQLLNPTIPGSHANLCRRSSCWHYTTLTMTVYPLNTSWTLLSWVLQLKYLWPLDLLSKKCICIGIYVEEVPIQTSPCPIMMAKRKERSRPIGQVPADPLQTKPRWSVWLSGATWVNMNIVLKKWSPGSHGKLGSLSLPISSNYSYVRIITVRIPMCSSAILLMLLSMINMSEKDNRHICSWL